MTKWLELIQLHDKMMGIATIVRNQRDSKLENKWNRLRRQRDMLEDNFSVLESRLAKIENREPRKISTDFIPPAAPR